MTVRHFRFLDWQVYKDSKLLYKNILLIVSKLTPAQKFGIGDQITRSSLSVSLNIAEGSGKHSDKDFNRFINTSLGSLFETVAAIDILFDEKIINLEQHVALLELCTSISNQLGGLKKKLV